MLLGQLPRPGVLEQHGLRQYQPIAEAMRSGSIGTLNRALAANQRRFIMEVWLPSSRRSCHTFDSNKHFMADTARSGSTGALNQALAANR